MVITALTRNQVVRKGSWVRIPPSPPNLHNPNLVIAKRFTALVLRLCAIKRTRNNPRPFLLFLIHIAAICFLSPLSETAVKVILSPLNSMTVAQSSLSVSAEAEITG